MAVNVFEIFGTIGAKDNASKVLDDVAGKAKETNRTLSKTLSGIGNISTKVGTKLTSFVTKPALGATAALTGITLVKGFGRLVGIDTAKAKLKGLGHDAKSVETIMNSALESVKGTAFGMDEAATTAAGAVAAGVEPGKELTRYLSLAGDAAAIAGTSMSEMGSIINKVQTGQKAYTENLEQLANRGLPIYQWLGEEAGVAADQVKELASEGEISSEMFLNAIEKNIGGAAKIMGETSFLAAVQNIGAAIGRIGANFLDAGGEGGGFFSKLKPLMADFMARLEKIEDKAAELGEKFGDSFQTVIDIVSELIAKFDAMEPAAQKSFLKTIGVGATAAVAMGPALEIFGKFSSVMGGVAEISENLTGKFNNIGSTAASVFGKTKGKVGDLRKNFLSLFDDVKTTGSGVKDVVASFIPESLITKITDTKVKMSDMVMSTGVRFEQLGDKIGMLSLRLGSMSGRFERSGIFSVVDKVKGKFAQLTPAFGKVGTGVTGVMSKTTGALTSIMGLAMKMIGPGAIIGALVVGLGLIQGSFGDQINSMLAKAQTQGPELVQKFIDGIVTKIPDLMAQGTTLIINFLNAIIANLPSIIQGGVQIIVSLLDGVATNFPRIIPVVLMLVQTLFNALIQNLPTLLMAGLNLLMAIIQGISDNLPLIIQTIISMITTLITTITENLPQILETGIAILFAIINGLIQAIPDLVAALPEIFDAIKTAFAEVDWLKLGKDIIDGVMKGIKEAAENLGEAVKKVAGNVKDWFAEKLGIKSPSTVMAEQGGFVIAGVEQGITTNQSSVQNAVSGVTGVITGAFNNIGTNLNINQIVNQGVQIANAMVNGVRQGLAQLPSVGSSAMNQFAAQLSMRSGVSINAGKQLGQGILNGVRGGLSQLPTVGMTYMNVFIQRMMVKATQGRSVGLRVGQSFTGGVDSSRGTVLSTANRLLTMFLNAILNFLSKIRNAGVRLIQMLLAGITSMQNTLLNKATQLSKTIVQTFEKQGSAMRNAGADLIKKLAQGITSSKSAVNTAMRGVSGTMLTAISKGINGVIGGVNHVMGQVGSSKKVKAWTIPKYAKGTDGHPEDGLAMVNDASTGPYQEAYQTPDGRVGLFPRMRNLLVNLKKGTKVLSGKMTAKLGMIPRYEEGIGFDEDIFEYLDNPKGLLQKAVDARTNLKGVVEPWLDMTKSAMRLMTDEAVPMIKTEMDKLMVSGGGPGAFAPNFPNPPFIKTSDRGSRWGGFHAGIDFAAPIGTPIPANNPGRVVRAEGGVSGFGKWVVVEVAKGIMAIYGHISKWLVNAGQNVTKGQKIALVGNEGQSTGPHLHYELRKGLGGPSLDPYTYGAPSGSAGGSGVARWRPTILQALLRNGLPTTANYVNAWMKQIQTESGGNEKAIGGNDGLADGNAMGLLQVKPGTFNAYKHKGFNQILRGLDNALAAINYAKNRYGVSGMLGVIGHGHGYANGGFSAKHKLAEISEGNRLESIVPLTKTRRAWEVISQSIGYLVGKGSVPDIRALDARSISSQPNQMASETRSSDSDVLIDIFGLFKEFVTLFKEGQFGVYMDKYQVGAITAEPSDYYAGQRIDLTGRGLNI